MPTFWRIFGVASLVYAVFAAAGGALLPACGMALTGAYLILTADEADA